MSFVRLPDFIRTTTFRWTLVIAGSFVVCTLLLFAFVYWQTAVYMTRTFDAVLMQDTQTLAADSPGRRLEAIEGRLRNDPRHVFIRAVFDANGQRSIGNLENLPSGLAPDVPVQAQIVRLDGNAREIQRGKEIKVRRQPEMIGDASRDQPPDQVARHIAGNIGSERAGGVHRAAFLAEIGEREGKGRCHA